jgi:hypothetical protein
MSILIALGTTLLWTWHADRVRELNLLGEFLSSTNLKTFIYGTWSQFFSRTLWADVLPQRMLPQILGYGWPVLFLSLWYIRVRSAYTIFAVISAALFLVPIILFTNLHIVHDYYQTANSLFLIAAEALLVAEMLSVRRRFAAGLVSVVLLGGAVLHIVNNEWPIGTARHDLDPGFVAARKVRELSMPNSGLIVFGIDWSSEVHYYAERKGLALPVWASAPKVETILADPDTYMGGLGVGAVIDCRLVSFQKYSPEVTKLIDGFIDQWSQHSNLVSNPAETSSCLTYVRQT